MTVYNLTTGCIPTVISKKYENTFSSHNNTNVTVSNGFMCGYLKQILQMLIGELAVFFYYFYTVHTRKYAFKFLSMTKYAQYS